ncbi:hypothetical protein F5882DRAFT_402878 [Hyaloscypha sp. PMI_1271]|nr:hypothetical protein F5882DRAFT_402878 [Hyaloscypha sp. PMI_1271]
MDIFIELKKSFQSLKKYALSKAPQGPRSAVTFARFLDMREGDLFSFSVYDRVHLAMFAECINQDLKGERTSMDVKIKTQVYGKILEKHAPNLSKDSKEWSMKYRALENWYSNGKRWLKLVTALGWHSFLLLPHSGSGNVDHRDIHKLSAGGFDCLLLYLKKYKQEFLLKVCKKLEHAISITSIGKFNFQRQIRLESTSIDEITSYAEMSDKLCMLAEAM